MSTTLESKDFSFKKKDSPVEEKSLFDLFNSCRFNTITIEDNVIAASEDDEEDYGDDSTILSMHTSRRSILQSQGLQSEPPLLPTSPTPLDDKFWCEPDGSTFRVRSQSYMKSKKKEPSKDSLFRLFAVDMVEVEKPILTGICAHPYERVQKCIQAQKEGKPGSEMPPFIFCVNICVPGSPSFHAAFYYAVDDISLISPKSLDSNCDDMTSPNPAFTALATEFFFGSSDKFRDQTFKLIPRIAQGNFVVKSAVGSKPALIGTKVKQHYIQNERFFELIIDVGSDNIAKKVVGLSRGYVSCSIQYSSMFSHYYE